MYLFLYLICCGHVHVLYLPEETMCYVFTTVLFTAVQVK
jgi:hypothetical protein